jgi:hypothetical protein
MDETRPRHENLSKALHGWYDVAESLFQSVCARYVVEQGTGAIFQQVPKAAVLGS